MNDDITIRPATSDDILLFNKEPFQQTVRAWVVEYKGDTACIAGVARIDARTLLAFSHLAEGVKVPDITVWRTALRLFGKIKNIGLPVIADPDKNIPGAPRFLERLGFYPIEGGLFRYEN